MTDAKTQKFKELKESGQFKRIKDELLFLIKEYNEITIDEMCRITGRKNGTIGGRLSDLMDDGLIYEYGQSDNGQTTFKITHDEFIDEFKKVREKLKYERHIKALINSDHVNELTKQFLYAELTGDSIDKVQDAQTICINAIAVLRNCDNLDWDQHQMLTDLWYKIVGIKNDLSVQDKDNVLGVINSAKKSIEKR